MQNGTYAREVVGEPERLRKVITRTGFTAVARCKKKNGSPQPLEPLRKYRPCHDITDQQIEFGPVHPIPGIVPLAGNVNRRAILRYPFRR